jgi:hypothetical protein
VSQEAEDRASSVHEQIRRTQEQLEESIRRARELLIETELGIREIGSVIRGSIETEPAGEGDGPGSSASGG